MIDGKRHPLACTIADVSLGGCGIRLPVEFPVGSALHVRVSEGAQDYRVTAKVVNSRPGPHGQGWFAGVMFDPGAVGFNVALRSIWMGLQREQIQRLHGNRDVQV